AGTAWVDEYGLAALAQLLLHPLHGVLDRHPAAAEHLAAGLPVLPADLWREAARRRPAPSAATSHGPSPAPPSPPRAARPQAPVPGMPTPGMPGSEVASPQRAASPQVPRLPAPTPEVPSTGVPGSAVVSPQVLSSGVPGPGMPRPGVPGLQEVRVLGLRVPSPGEVAQAPGEWLAWLAGRVAVGLAAMCDPA